MIFILMLFKYTLDYLADEPIMLIDKHIGIDEMGVAGIIGDEFANELLALDSMGKKRIQVWINSVGGSVIDGMSIYNAILRTKTKVDTYNVGVAASTAGWLFLAGRKRYMNDYAIFMMHKPTGSGSGLEAFENSITTMIANRCHKSYDEISDMMEKETWLDAAQCMEYGMCDEISDSGGMNKRRLTAMAVSDAWAYSNKILNRSLNKNTMIKVTNKLGLVADANEDSIVDAITGIENKANEYKNNMELAEKENEALKARIQELENEKAMQAAAVVEEKAEAFATQAAADGKIENTAEAITALKNQLVKDFDGTKAIIEAIPMNKAAVKIEKTVDTSVQPVETTAVQYMAKVLNNLKNKNK